VVINLDVKKIETFFIVDYLVYVNTTKEKGDNMAGKIFYRERNKVGTKEKSPRFALVAVTGMELEFYSNHLRKKELEEIAGAMGAELVLLKTDPKDKSDEMVEVKK